MAPARVVERLRLRAESEAALRRALPLLEDAFRTATLPDAGARLLCVRRLHLGRLPSREPAQALTRLIESRVAAAEWRLVHAGDTSADGAHAVWFRDTLEAHELAAQRIAAGQTLDAWFWPLAVPALERADTPSDKLRTIAFAVAALQGAPAALPAWVSALVRAGRVTALIDALRPGDGATLQRAAGITTRPPMSIMPGAPTDSGAPPVISGAVSEGSRPAATDDRVEFVREMLRASGHPHPLPVPIVTDSRPLHATGRGIARRASAQAPATATPGYHARRADADIKPPTQNDLPDSVAGPKGSRNRPNGAAVPSSGRHAVARRKLRNEAHAAPKHGAHAPTPTAPWELPGTARTAAGGLLFLVPVLDRLGFGEWCASVPRERAHSPDELVRRILLRALTRLRIDAHDPAWELAASSDGEIRAADASLRAYVETHLDAIAPRRAPVARSATRDARASTHRRPLGNLRTDLQWDEAELWLAGCRALLRRRMRLGLATLIVRPARIALTTTHLDVFFGLHAADLRIRRAGLDLDPGWVPWLAKVVAFHYEDRPWT